MQPSLKIQECSSELGMQSTSIYLRSKSGNSALNGGKLKLFSRRGNLFHTSLPARIKGRKSLSEFEINKLEEVLDRAPWLCICMRYSK